LGERKGSSSFLKKRTKKLLSVGLRVRAISLLVAQHSDKIARQNKGLERDRHVLKRVKVFWFFFSKKNYFLSHFHFVPRVKVNDD